MLPNYRCVYLLSAFRSQESDITVDLLLQSRCSTIHDETMINNPHYSCMSFLLTHSQYCIVYCMLAEPVC